MKGYTLHLGKTSAFAVEVWVIKGGLTIALELNVTCLEIESDASNVIYASLYTSVNIPNLNSIWTECRHVLAELQQVRIKHVFRVSNQYADKLVSTAIYNIFTCNCFGSELETLVVLDKQRAISSEIQTRNWP